MPKSAVASQEISTRFCEGWLYPYPAKMTVHRSIRHSSPGPLYQHGFILIQILISNFDGAAIEVWEWLSNFTPHFTAHMITYPWWDQSLSILVKGSQASEWRVEIFIIVTSATLCCALSNLSSLYLKYLFLLKMLTIIVYLGYLKKCTVSKFFFQIHSRSHTC